MGLGRNLTPGEILEQVLRLARLLRDEQDARISNVVMMGMGEPFHNYDNVLAAFRTINDPEAFGLGARQIAISTAGWVPGIERLADEPMQVKLALSLHAPDDALRSELMPVTKRFPLDELMQACRRYREQTRRRIFVEYLLLDGVNDSSQQADSSPRCSPGGPGVPRQPDRLQPDRHRVRRGRRRPRAAFRGGWRRARSARPTASRTGRTSMPPAASS